MIGWLQGQLADRWQNGSRCGLLLVCQGVGYELQITRRHWDGLPPEGQALTLHVHQAIREDSWTLFGFAQRHERDLFRELVAVSGVGPQMALGLLGCLAGEELVRAIVQADLRLLCQAPGVGKRTAERLSVELRSRLQERYGTGLADDGAVDDDGGAVWGEAAAPQLREELQLTLAALGYEPLEINRALRAVAAQQPPDLHDGEGWLRESLRWLSASQVA
ncbi:MAG: Holliday junction branch migration protein RuvA [Vulcanococcus sp.]|jgi:Holliday junction DNA helicase RuvA